MDFEGARLSEDGSAYGVKDRKHDPARAWNAVRSVDVARAGIEADALLAHYLQWKGARGGEPPARALPASRRQPSFARGDVVVDARVGGAGSFVDRSGHADRASPPGRIGRGDDTSASGEPLERRLDVDALRRHDEV